MRIRDTIIIALDSLSAHTLRSILTILGVVIGIASVITLLSVGDGLRNTILNSLRGLNPEVITVIPGDPFTESATANTSRLTQADAVALKNYQGSSAIVDVASEYQIGGTILFEKRSLGSSIRGVTVNFQNVHDIDLAFGRFIRDEDMLATQRVAVLGWDLGRELFQEQHPLGRSIHINGYRFEVIGVLKSAGILNFDQNLAVFVPLSTVQQRLAYSQIQRHLDVTQLSIRAVDIDSIPQVRQQTQTILRNQHQLAPTEANTFTITANQDILNLVNGIVSGLTYFLSFVGAISLLVGGIGIMNIMLVSVTQRTREIGLRRAVGATRRHIVLQFLTEAIVLSFSGGVLGILLGYSLTITIAIVLSSVQGTTFVTGLTVSSVIVATTSSLLIGLIFGIYPALQAAQMTPTDALRYE